MNEQLQKQAEALEAAAIERVYKPAFVKAAQARGLAINSEDDLNDLLAIVSQAKAKQASVTTGVYKQVLADLTGEKQASAPSPASPFAIPQEAWQGYVKQAAVTPEVQELAAALLQFNAAAQQAA